MLSRCFLDFSVGIGAFVIGLSQISFFFSHTLRKTLTCQGGFKISFCSCWPELRDFGYIYITHSLISYYLNAGFWVLNNDNRWLKSYNTFLFVYHRPNPTTRSFQLNFEKF